MQQVDGKLAERDSCWHGWRLGKAFGVYMEPENAEICRGCVGKFAGIHHHKSRYPNELLFGSTNAPT